MPISHLSAQELADRWRIGRRTLDRWRWVGEGPAFLKLGGRVVYRLQDIETFEADRLRQVTGPEAEFRGSQANHCADQVQAPKTGLRRNTRHCDRQKNAGGALVRSRTHNCAVLR